MNCPDCKHINLSDFPFCEECLTLLPARKEGFGFDLNIAALPSSGRAARDFQPFPWSPSGMTSPLIGRDRQLKALMESWQEVVKTWTARIHLLVSEYGLGKGYLTQCLADEVGKRDQKTRIVTVQCPEFGGPFRLWDGVLRAIFEIPHQADPVETGIQFYRAVEELFPEQALEVAGLISALTGYEIPGVEGENISRDEEAMLGRSTGALVRLLAEVAKEPLLIVVNRANLGSARSLAIAGAIEATLKGKPVMLLLSGVPQLSEILPGWDRFPLTRLGPLTKRDTKRMLSVLLEGLPAAPVELTDSLVTRSGGNPAALKSMVQYVRDMGGVQIEKGRWVIDENTVWDLQLPDDLEGVLYARIGQLSSRERQVLGHAAVVGKRFWFGVLVALARQNEVPSSSSQAMIDDGLPEEIREALEILVEQRFIEKLPENLRGEASYAFRSDLHWQAAGDLLTAVARERCHHIVSQWLMLSSENPTGEQCAVIAHHAELAGQPEVAARFLLKSGEMAKGMGQPAERLSGLRRAAALVPASDLALKYHISMDLGEALKSLSGDIEGATNCFEEALHLAWRLRNRGKAADALSRIGMLETERGLFDAALEHLELALRLYEAINDRKGVAATCIHLGRMLWLHGRFSEALHSYRKSESLYQALRDDRGLADTEHAVATLYYDQGDLVLAEEHYLKVLALREKTQDDYERASVMNNLGAVWAAQGDQERAIETWREGLELASELGHRSLEATLSNNLGEGLMHLGKLEEAEPYIDNAIVLAHATEHIRLIIDAYTNRAFIHMQLCNWSGSEEAIEQAILENRKLPVPKQSGQVFRCQGDLAFIRGSQKVESQELKDTLLEEAESHFTAAIRCFEEADYDLESANTHEKLGDLFGFLGRTDEEKSERETAAALRGKHNLKED